MDGCFLQTKVEGENGRPAAPRTSRAHRYVMPQSLRPQVNVCCDFCYPCAFISHVWSKLSEMYLKILSIFLRKGWTHNNRKGCENTGSIGVGVSFVQAQNSWLKTSSSRQALSLGANGNFSSVFITSSSPSRCVAGVWLIKAAQIGAVALYHLVLLLCVASASWEQRYSFSEEQGLPLVAINMRRFPPFFLYV
jgi:hypothetical protein